MSEHRPWNRGDADPAVAEAAQLLERARPVRDWSPAAQEDFFRRFEARRAAPPAAPGWAWAGGAVAATALVALSLLLWRAPPPAPAPAPAAVAALQRVDLGELGHLELSPDARFHRGADPANSDEARHIYLEQGALTAAIAHQEARHPFMVITPHVRVVVVGTRFSVEVDPTGTTVSVQQGRVRVESLRGSAMLVGPGERVRSDDPRLAQAPRAASSAATDAAAQTANEAPPGPAHPEPSPRAPVEPPRRCERTLPVAERQACLEQLSRGEGLAAQNGLFELSRLELEAQHPERAVEHLREFQRRFPASMLAPEVSLSLITGLLAAGQEAEALQETGHFLAQHGQDARAAQVSLIRANLLRERMGQTAEALGLYQQVLARAARPELQDEALYFVGVCQAALGQPEQAQQTWRRYRARFPRGAHAAEVERLAR